MRFYPKQHPFYWGIARHARPMDVCLLDQAGATLLHRHMPATPEALRTASAPSPRSDRPGGPLCCTWEALWPRARPLHARIIHEG